MTERSN